MLSKALGIDKKQKRERDARRAARHRKLIVQDKFIAEGNLAQVAELDRIKSASRRKKLITIFVISTIIGVSGITTVILLNK